MSTENIRREQRESYSFVAVERQEYKLKAELGSLRPSEYLSICVDGADQSAFSLPHFVQSVKDDRGHGLKVSLVGILQHGQPNKLNLFTMTENHEKGSNHIVEAIHRCINQRFRDGFLPKHFFVQFDNCVSENKNHFVFSYFDYLMDMNVFDSIEVGFLPVGHTHCDIDQCFSSTSNCLRQNDAVNLNELQSLLCKSNAENTEVRSMNQVANWSKLCSDSKCINVLDNIT